MTGINFKTHSGMLCHNIYYGSGFRVLSRAIPKLVGILRRKAAEEDFLYFHYLGERRSYCNSICPVIRLRFSFFKSAYCICPLV